MNKFNIILTNDAKLDLDDIVGWLDEQGEGLTEKFRVDLDYCVDKIRQNPKTYGLVTKRTRIATLRNFPHCVYFRAVSDHEVRIVAIVHGSRHPNTWRRRSNPKE